MKWPEKQEWDGTKHVYHSTEDLGFSQTCHVLMEEILGAKAGPMLIELSWEMPSKGTFKHFFSDLMFSKAFLLDMILKAIGIYMYTI